MKRLSKFFKKKIYLIVGFAYLSGVLASFLFVASSIVGAIDKSLPGGSEIIVPQATFNLEAYKKIESLVGVPLKEPVKGAVETLPKPVEETAEAPTEKPVEETAEKPAEAPTEKPVEESVEAPKLDISSLKVSVLNGGSIVGAAGNFRLVLEAEGFKVLSVGGVGRAERVEKSFLEIKESKKAYEVLIRAVIEKTYTIHEVRILEETNEADAVFTIGLE